MAAVNRILYALELSGISERIAPWVTLAVKTFQAQLHVLHVVPSMEVWGLPYASQLIEGRHDGELILKVQKEVIAFYEEHLGYRETATIKVTAGRPAECIIDYVRENNIDLVIVGTHGRKGLDKAVFGSVADRVLRMSPVPVLYINPFRGQAAA